MRINSYANYVTAAAITLCVRCLFCRHGNVIAVPSNINNNFHKLAGFRTNMNTKAKHINKNHERKKDKKIKFSIEKRVCACACACTFILIF